MWNLAIDLATSVYDFSTGFPKSEVYGLPSQMRRASVSIASNIAEGSGRSSRKDFRHFVTMAHGSNCELQTQLEIAQRLGFATPETLDHTEVLSREVGRLLNGLLKYLSSEPDPTTRT